MVVRSHMAVASRPEDLAGMTQSVQRVLSLLLLFDRLHPRWRVVELAREAGLPQSTVSRLLNNLESMGFVERDESTGQYQLGLSLVMLGGIALTNDEIFRHGVAEVGALAAEFHLDANLAILKQDRLFYLAALEYPAPRSAFPLSGYTDHLHSTGLGAALLSGMSEDEREAILRRIEYPRVTAFTPGSSDEFRARIMSAVERGYAVDREANNRGFGCVAAPIFDAHRRVVAACSVSGTLSALDLERRVDELGGRIVEVAGLISRNLGYGEALAGRRG